MKNTNLINVSPFFEAAKRFFGDEDFRLIPFQKNNIGHANIKDQENEFIVELSVPGIKKEEVKINLDNDILTISFENVQEDEKKTDTYCRREFYSESFERSFTIPKSINKEEISAKMEDGILILTIPKLKKEEKKLDNIEIKVK